jgi:hypothetical protein
MENPLENLGRTLENIEKKPWESFGKTLEKSSKNPGFIFLN